MPTKPIHVTIRRIRILGIHHCMHYETDAQGKRNRERSRKTCKETLRKDLKYLELTDDLA